MEKVLSSSQSSRLGPSWAFIIALRTPTSVAWLPPALPVLIEALPSFHPLRHGLYASLLVGSMGPTGGHS